MQLAPSSTVSGRRNAEKPSSEQTVSSQEAKELFRSVDELLKFASDDTGLPIKHEVKRKLADRKEVEEYLEKGMKDDEDAKRLERSSEVLEEVWVDSTGFSVGNVSGSDAEGTGGGILRSEKDGRTSDG